MKVAVRVEASQEAGIGHAIRCLALAEHLKQASATVTFFSEKLVEDVRQEIETAGFHVRGANQLRGMQMDWLVVDNYALDREYEHEMRRVASHIMVIDDLANRNHDCDLLVDQNMYKNMHARYAELVPPECKVLAGPRFALLRPRFLAMARNVPSGRDIRRIFVFFGGSDLPNETAKCLKAISQLELPDIAVDVLIGPANRWRDEIKEFANLHELIRCWTGMSDIVDLMRAADLAIGAGGATSWERCYLGLPSVVISIAENQVEIAQELAKAGCHLYLGRSEEISSDDIADAIRFCIGNAAETRRLGQDGKRLVDGCGAQRVVAEMLAI